MLVVTNLQGQTEALTDYKDLQIRRRVNSEFSLSFLLFKTDRNAHSYNLVSEESIIEYNGQEYRIKRINEKSLGNAAAKEVQASHVFFDLIDDYEYGVIGGNQTIDSLVSFALTGTNFTFEIADTFEPTTIFNFGEKNRLALVQEICKLFGAEIEQRGRHLVFKKQIGRNSDFQFRFRHNLKTISREVDTSDLTTVIRGYGANGLAVEYRSPMADIYGERHAEPFKDEQITDQATLFERIKKEIKDEPNISFEIEFVELKKAGYPFEEVGLGDTVYVIYEPLGIDITARVVEYTEYPESPKSSTVLLSNFRKTVADIIEKINDNVKETEKQVSLARSEIKQTNERITLEVTQIDERLDETEAQIDLQAGQIELKVSKNEVISAINLSPETISISASKINLTGAVTISSLASDVRTTLDSKQDYFGVVSIVNGTVTADYVNALGITAKWVSADSLLGSRLYIGKNGVSQSTFLEMFTSDGGAHYIKSNQAAGFRIESTGSLSLQTGPGYPVNINAFTRIQNNNLSVENAAGTPLLATNLNNMSVAVSGDLNANYINAAYSLRVGGWDVATQNWVSNNFASIWHTHSNYIEWVDTYRIPRGGASLKFLYGSATIQARNYWDTAYGTFEGLAYSNVSKRELKKDIEPFAGDALKLIAETPVYSYRYKSDLDIEPKRVGLIYDEAPVEIMMFTGGIDVYGMASLMWKAIQELDKKIEGVKQIA